MSFVQYQLFKQDLKVHITKEEIFTFLLLKSRKDSTYVLICKIQIIPVALIEIEGGLQLRERLDLEEFLNLVNLIQIRPHCKAQQQGGEGN